MKSIRLKKPKNDELPLQRKTRIKVKITIDVILQTLICKRFKMLQNFVTQQCRTSSKSVRFKNDLHLLADRRFPETNVVALDMTLYMQPDISTITDMSRFAALRRVHLCQFQFEYWTERRE